MSMFRMTGEQPADDIGDEKAADETSGENPAVEAESLPGGGDGDRIDDWRCKQKGHRF